ncbi:DUF406 family protein [Shewanella aestuarii]|uniref:DUF406 family protein n=1 Tax=Shewanella aestuarii TaxID=1028752 RepID=A0A6G9QJ28_9GAMM|nr:DUF406 family protein [Shewanella aestuarii]QIR14516.1 DUF406 family protein [Shewanella aestuarii]
MIDTIKKQQDNVNDTCTDCGSFVDIGAVIDENDNVLNLIFNGENAEKEAQLVVEKAKNRFDKVDAVINKNDNKVDVVLTFSVTVEKMLFQMENSL